MAHCKENCCSNCLFHNWVVLYNWCDELCYFFSANAKDQQEYQTGFLPDAYRFDLHNFKLLIPLGDQILFTEYYVDFFALLTMVAYVAAYYYYGKETIIQSKFNSFVLFFTNHSYAPYFNRKHLWWELPLLQHCNWCSCYDISMVEICQHTCCVSIHWNHFSHVFPCFVDHFNVLGYILSNSIGICNLFLENAQHQRCSGEKLLQQHHKGNALQNQTFLLTYRESQGKLFLLKRLLLKIGVSVWAKLTIFGI